jgi:hypothetical protein
MALTFQHYQQDCFTKSNRYPELFSCSAQISKRSDKILSFGCSTGEECQSLRMYFPDALIYGFDIVPSNIETANLNNTDARIVFTSTLDTTDVFDLIFCMSVFTRWPDIKGKTSCSGILDFKNFERDIGLLLELLRPGGLIALFNSSFAIEDTKYEWSLKPIPFSYRHGVGWVPVFDRNHNIKEWGKHIIFEKRPRVL